MNMESFNVENSNNFYHLSVFSCFFQSFYQMSYSYLDHMTGFYLLITILSIAAMILTPGPSVSGENFSVSTYDKQILNTNVSHVSQSILGSSTIQEQRPIPTRISSLRSEGRLGIPRDL